MGPDALTSLVEALGGGIPPSVAFRVDGAWVSCGPVFGHEVRSLAAALAGYGLGVGARAAVLGSEGGGTLRAHLAVLAAGATLVPLHPGLTEDALQSALASSGAVHVICSDESQLARVLSLRPDLPALDMVLLSTAAPSERKPAALLVATAIAVGDASLSADPGVLERALAEGVGGAACILVDPRGPARTVSRAELLESAETMARTLGAARGGTVFVSLPVGSVERLCAALAALIHGAALLVADPVGRPDSGLDQRPPDRILLDATGLERLHRAWLEDVQAMSWLGRSVTRWALRQGREPARHRFKHRIAEAVALRRLRARLGGAAAGLDVVAAPGAGRSGDVEPFFEAVGVTVRYHAPSPAVVLAR